MKKTLLAFLVISCIALNVFAQCTGTQLNWLNPSFEGTAGTPHVTPPQWNICMPGYTPDTQPGCWGVTLPPSNGSSYIGLVHQSSTGWQEGAGQQLSSPMVAGTTYTFTMDLATVDPSVDWSTSGIVPGCVELQVFGNMGGNSGCDQTYLCWSSGNVTNFANWQTYTVSFTATQNWTNLLFMIHSLGCTDGPYLLMDNMTPVQPISDIPQFTWNDVCLGNATQFTDGSTSAQGTINSWNWDYGDGSPPGTTQNPTHTYSTAGTYNTTLTITSTVPCTTTVSHQVVVNPMPTVTVSPGTTSTCTGNGVSCTASGAASYQWAPAAGLSATTGSNVTANPAVTTPYTVTGTDANGCTATTSFTINVSANLTPTIATTNATCGQSNGTATASVAGMNYIWNNGQTTQVLNNLGAGNYTVTVSDGNGCSGSASCVVNSFPGGSVTITSTDENCGHSNGTATATAVGGTAPITYSWSNLQSTQIINGLSGGTYTVTTSDANGCTSSGTVTIQNIAGPSLQVTNVINETCSKGNGSATVNAVNGVSPYTYAWATGASGVTANNLSAGTIGITVTDVNNCTAFNTVNVSNTPPPTLATAANPADCGQSDGSATVNVNGGGLPYSFVWNSTPQQTSQTAMNIPSGTYTVTVSDGNGCTVTANSIVTSTNNPSATAISTNEYCDQSDGTATVTAIGGSGTYTYLWNNGQILQTATGLAAGSYTVTVNDGFCTTTANAFVTGIPGPDAGFSCNPQVLTMLDGPVSFLDNSSGNIVNWQWNYGDGSPYGSNASNEHMYENLGSFLVTLIVTDNNGCKDTVQDTVKVKEIYTIYIPNAFTPNEDYINDLFFPQGISIDPNEYEMAIFDRWGKLVFKSTTYGEGWNGTLNNKGDVKKVVMDAYVYRIKIKEVDGPRHEYIGRVSLIP
jgi:gliding motility-associated-like protein